MGLELSYISDYLRAYARKPNAGVVSFFCAGVFPFIGVLMQGLLGALIGDVCCFVCKRFSACWCFLSMCWCFSLRRCFYFFRALVFFLRGRCVFSWCFCSPVIFCRGVGVCWCALVFFSAQDFLRAPVFLCWCVSVLFKGSLKQKACTLQRFLLQRSMYELAKSCLIK